MILKERKYMLILTKLEEINLEHIILEHTSCLLLAERYLVLMFGKMELRKLLNKLIWILLTLRELLMKKNYKLKMKLTELLMNAI